MPEQTYPPYATGAKTVPRQLNRWMDVNPQNGALQRTATYITLPAFAQSVSTWNGFSDIVFSFNFESPNKFALKSFVSPVTNYALTISYRYSTGGGVRYLLWDATGSNLNQNIPVYSGQIIANNFRLEVWNTSQGVASQSVPLSMFTSVKGQLDYRFGTDTVLVNDDGQVSAFSYASTAGTFTLPMVFPSTSVSQPN